jgi:hypothetical protein
MKLLLVAMTFIFGLMFFTIMIPLGGIVIGLATDTSTCVEYDYYERECLEYKR